MVFVWREQIIFLRLMRFFVKLQGRTSGIKPEVPAIFFTLRFNIKNNLEPLTLSDY